MGLKGTLAKGAVALSVSGAPLVLGVSPAGAIESYSQSASFDHTFTNGSGQTVVCPVNVSSSLIRESSGDPFFGAAFTGSNTDDPSCDAFVAVDVTFTDPAGRQKSAFADSFRGDVFLGVDDVGSGFVANHFVAFLNCSANCEVSYQTQPK